MHWPDIQSVTANFQRIRLALGDHYNGRGPAVYGRCGEKWVQLNRVTVDRGVPYGHTYEESFVLREAKAGDGETNSPEG